MRHDYAATMIRGRRGAALVECALVLPFLLFLTLGVVEIGRMTRSQLALAQATREGSQAAARGLTVVRIYGRIMNTASQGGLNRSAVTITDLSQSSNGNNWSMIGDSMDGSGNNARSRNLVRVTVHYRHALLTTYVFRGGTRDLSCTLVSRRN